MGKFVIRTTDTGLYYSTLHAGNGQVILTSPEHLHKSGCVQQIQAIVEHAVLPGCFQQHRADDGRYYFTLVSTLGELLGQSERYETVPGRDNGIASVRLNAARATILQPAQQL